MGVTRFPYGISVAAAGDTEHYPVGNTVEGVKSGALILRPGEPTPQIIEAAPGRKVQGTGRALTALSQVELTDIAKHAKSAEGRAWFNRRMMEERAVKETGEIVVTREWLLTRVLDAIELGEKGWDRLAEALLMHIIGKPRETSDTSTRAVELILESMGTVRRATVRTIEGPSVEVLDD